MDLINNFEPKDGPGNAKFIWIVSGTFFLILSVVMVFSRASLNVHFIWEGLNFIICAIMVIAIRLPTLVTISGINNTVNYTSIGCLGKEKTTTVELSDAKISYKIVLIGKTKRGWRLRLYKKFFKNRISINEFNFTKEQMDRMVEIINKYRGIPINTH